MKSLRYTCVAVLALLVHGWTASARLMPLSDDDVGTLAHKADVVMIGRVLAVRETAEEATLSDISPEVKVRGVETTFFAESVLKGDLTSHVIVLHHYDSSALFQNGPLLVRFAASSHRHYLLFLKREADGRYAPAAGQTDAAISIRRVLGSIEGLNKAAEEERSDRRNADRQAQPIKESADAPLVLEFVKMETEDGVTKRARMKVINRTSKDVYAYSLQTWFFREDGSLADTASTATSAAVGHTSVRARGQAVTTPTGHTDNYDTTRAQAVVTSVTFTDGSKWEAK